MTEVDQQSPIKQWFERAQLTIDYTNYRGERSERVIVPLEIRFGISTWHPEEQWLLRAFDVLKGEMREFAMVDIHAMEKVKE